MVEMELNLWVPKHTANLCKQMSAPNFTANRFFEFQLFYTFVLEKPKNFPVNSITFCSGSQEFVTGRLVLHDLVG